VAAIQNLVKETCFTAGRGNVAPQVLKSASYIFHITYYRATLVPIVLEHTDTVGGLLRPPYTRQ